MARDTHEDARVRELQHAGTRFLERITPGQNVYALVRDPGVYPQPCIATYATSSPYRTCSA
jgi:hypothetical protein